MSPELLAAHKAVQQAESFFWNEDAAEVSLYFQKAQALALIVIAEQLTRANEEWK